MQFWIKIYLQFCPFEALLFSEEAFMYSEYDIKTDLFADRNQEANELCVG